MLIPNPEAGATTAMLPELKIMQSSCADAARIVVDSDAQPTGNRIAHTVDTDGSRRSLHVSVT